MKLSISKYGRNYWLRVNDRYFGFVPQGIKGYPYIATRKVGPFVVQDTKGNYRQGYHVYAGIILAAMVIVRLGIGLINFLIERGM